MAAMIYFDCMESEMSRDQFEDFGRKLVLALAQRFGESLQTSSSGAALLDEALHVRQYFNLPHFIRIIILHYLCMSTMNFRKMHTPSPDDRLQQENNLEPTVCKSSASEPGAQSQLQHDFEAVLRQSKEARERKYDQEHIVYLDEQRGTARRTIWALLVVTSWSSKFLLARGISPLR
jgi:hypothetical protein